MDKAQLVFFIVITTIVCASFIAGIIYFLIVFRNKKIEHIKETNTLLEQHKNAMLQTQLEIQQHTMLHIGEELHDSVGQKLTLASLYTQQIDYENKYPEISNRITELGNLLNESLDELRNISKNLTTAHYHNSSLYNLVFYEYNRIKKLKKCNIIFTHKNIEDLQINNHSKTFLLRIIQECLTNSLKHSKCTLITINISAIHNFLIVSINDDGIGFNINKLNNSVGLKSITHRVNCIGGTLNIESKTAQGTTTTIKVNLEKITL